MGRAWDEHPQLIVQMAQENPTWGQARVAAELSVKLGMYVSPRTVRAYWPPEPGAMRQREDLFAELEDVCSQSRPVHRRLRFPSRSDRPVPNSLCVPLFGPYITSFERAMGIEPTSEAWEA